jgi:hypothetical protein
METIQFRMNKNLFIGILAFLAGAALSYIVFTLIADKPKTSVNPIPVEQDNGIGGPVIIDPTITPSQTNPDENILVSKALGISFSYLKYGYSYDENDHGIIRSILVNSPKVEGNKISFGSTYSSSMTMYLKQENQSLEAAVTSQFLSGIPATKCLPVRVVAGTESAYYTPGNGISYVVLRSITPGGCPSQFDFNNPSAAFVSFSSQPNKFFYVVGEPDGMMPLITAEGKPFWTTMKFTVN